MIHLTAATEIQLAFEPLDFRKGMDGVAAVCRERLQADPRSGTLFVFHNRSRTSLRVLVYDGTGFVTLRPVSSTSPPFCATSIQLSPASLTVC